jgi:uncharacterized cupredoxin-like copper-binding protein
VATIRSLALCAVFALTAIAFGACSSSDGETVDVAVADFSVEPAESSVAAGDVKFKVKNSGTFAHELVVVKLADASDVPTKPNGEVNEDAIPEAKRIGEVEDVKPDTTKTLKLKLDAGKYVLFCNRVDGTKIHFKEGMHADFTVTS